MEIVIIALEQLIYPLDTQTTAQSSISSTSLSLSPLYAGAEEFVPAYTEVLLSMLLCVSAMVARAYQE